MGYHIIEYVMWGLISLNLLLCIFIFITTDELLRTNETIRLKSLMITMQTETINKLEVTVKKQEETIKKQEETIKKLEEML